MRRPTTILLLLILGCGASAVARAQVTGSYDGDLSGPKLTASIDAAAALEREILESGNHAVDVLQRLRQRRGQIGRGDVQLVIAHREKQIAPARGRQAAAHRRDLIDEGTRGSLIKDV